MGFVELDQVFEDTLNLPVGGKTYTIPAPDALFGLWCQRVIEAGYLIQQGVKPEEVGDMPPFPLEDGTVLQVEAGKIDADHAMYRRLLGDVWDQLHADGVSWPRIQVVAQTAMIWVGVGVEAAETFWNSGGNPEAFAPNRQARRSTATVGADTTRKPSSTSTTKSRRTATGKSTRKS